MKVLLYHQTPFSLAHGGLQIQINRTQEALQQLGVQAEFLRWYDGNQSGEILHFFGRIPTTLLGFARQKGMKVVLADLLTEQGSRSAARLKLQKIVTALLRKASPGLSSLIFNWDSYRQADACIALTPWEAHLMMDLFGAPKEKMHVVPNGVEEVFLSSQAAKRGPWLVCTATITERKRVLELAEAAVEAKTPVWVIGKAYSESDDYSRRFVQLAQENAQFVRYEGAIGDRARLVQIYREARGFVLLSAMESLSLSALEAAACECPLLLSDLPWGRTVFGASACYYPLSRSSSRTAHFLREFYDAAPTLKAPPKPAAWAEVAEQLKRVYESVLECRNTSL